MLSFVAATAHADEHVYALRATLDPEAHSVDGEARIHFVNTSRAPLDALVFHLYLNAFQPGSVFERESGGRMRGVSAEGNGDIDIARMVDGAGRDLLAGADRELIEGDHTQMRVPLPEPLVPGAAIDLTIEFDAHLPPVYARSGYAGTFHCVAQWFPKLATLEPDGHFASFPYHARGEFYADFARYELEVTAPRDFVIGATGERVEEREDAAMRTQRFVADRVTDAVFVAFDRFEERRFDAAGVQVRLLYPRGFDLSIDRHERVVRQGLARFGTLYGPYPYSYLTVVVPPSNADGAAAMEYPTLFLTDGGWLPSPVDLAEGTTAHELAHQWFQHLVASDEVAHPMLDEGLAQYAMHDMMSALRGRDRSGLALFALGVDMAEGTRRFATRRLGETPPPSQPAYAFAESAYGRSVYSRTAAVLETIGRAWGRRYLQRALGSYAREQRFSHPTPPDLYRSFDRAYYDGFSRDVLQPALERGLTAETQVLSLTREGERARVVAARIGLLPVPLWVELRHADGHRERVRWPARELVFDHASPTLRGVVIDPDRANMLDGNALDDVATLDPGPRSHGLFARALALAHAWLGTWGP